MLRRCSGVAGDLALVRMWPRELVPGDPSQGRCGVYDGAMRKSGIILLAVAAGGAIGATARHAFSATFPADPGTFAWATFTENIIGSFLLGFALVVVIERMPRTRLVQPFLCTGVLGSFTTFSNYSVEIIEMLHNGRPLVGVVYALSSIVFGLIAAMCGMAAAGHFRGVWEVGGDQGNGQDQEEQL